MAESLDHNIEKSSTIGGLPVSPSMGPALESAHLSGHDALIDRRCIFICILAIAIANIAALLAEALVRLINLITNLSFFAEFSFQQTAPSSAHFGAFIIVIPIIGGLIVGLIARYGSKAVRGHGIPEAMEQVLTNQSRIPARVTFLKPLSAAIAIGTGGPFGAEGPIIATGGALGSLVGQLLKTKAAERKTLLAAGAAAGMAATFGCPVSAVLLAVELLLFEFRPRSIIPVALASATAASVRILFHGAVPMFPMEILHTPSGLAMALYIALGGVVGFFAVGVTRVLYLLEDGFSKLPIHWMWWPAIGAVAVGVIGYFQPNTLGVGYANITNILNNDLHGSFTLKLVILLCVFKFISWAIALGSGTSGGTLAPLFTIGGALGTVLGAGLVYFLPSVGVDVRIAALVGMAAMFAGASRALLTSVVFAFETTRQPLGLLPLLGGCSASFLVSCLLMRHTIMTEKIARRGIHVPAEYLADFVDQMLVRDIAPQDIVTLNADHTLRQVREWLASDAFGANHQGFPVVDESKKLFGILTLRDLLDPAHPLDQPIRRLIRRPPISVRANQSLRDAENLMMHHKVGRLPVVSPMPPHQLVGMITRHDLLNAHRMV